MLFEAIYQHRESPITKFKLVLASHVSLIIGAVHALLPFTVRLVSLGASVDAVGSLNRHELLYSAVSAVANVASTTALLRAVFNGLVHWDTYAFMLDTMSDVVCPLLSIPLCFSAS
jgi:hypothetical protein